MKKFIETLGTIAIVFLVTGFTFGPLFGLYVAFEKNDVWGAILSIVVPWYGIIYAIAHWFF